MREELPSRSSSNGGVSAAADALLSSLDEATHALGALDVRQTGATKMDKWMNGWRGYVFTC